MYVCVCVCVCVFIHWMCKKKKLLQISLKGQQINVPIHLSSVESRGNNT